MILAEIGLQALLSSGDAGCGSVSMLHGTCRWNRAHIGLESMRGMLLVALLPNQEDASHCWVDLADSMYVLAAGERLHLLPDNRRRLMGGAQ